MGRYTIDNEYVFFQIKIEYGTRRFGSAYCTWLGDKIESFNTVVLTCTEEHDVAWDQDPKQEKKYKGYLFKDKDGNVWANQYPMASGQLDDTADGLVRRWFDEHKIKGEGVEAFRKSPNGRIWEDQFWNPYKSAERILGDCHRGVKAVPEHAEEIQEYIKFLDDKLIEAGFMHKMRPIHPEHPDYLVPRVEKIDGATSYTVASAS